MTLEEHLKANGQTVAKKAAQTPQRGITAKFFDCYFKVDPGITSQLLATIKQQESSTSVRNAFWRRTTTASSSMEMEMESHGGHKS